MNAKKFSIRPIDTGKDFPRLAELFSSVETTPSTAKGLAEWYQRWQVKGMRLNVAPDENGQPLGLNCLYRMGEEADRNFGIYVIVDSSHRGQGLGSRLYVDLEKNARQSRAKKLNASVRDDDEASLRFAERRGFLKHNHQIEMVFDLEGFDPGRFEPMVAALKEQGIQFTNMAELGNTEEMQYKLYRLNSSTAATTPGTEGEEPWPSFEEFHKSVCQAPWYHPEGQIIAIDTRNGVWAAMSAITRFEGAEHAYNLYTGVRTAYRGRKLAQAVKSLALCYAADCLGTKTVRTEHNEMNAPMISIDRKLGYVQTPGTYGMVKVVE